MNFVTLCRILLVLVLLVPSTLVWAAEGAPAQKEGPYDVVEGNVTSITGRMLVIDGQQYPISRFARVYYGERRDRRGMLSTLANVGRVERAKLYLLGGTVERIVVLANL